MQEIILTNEFLNPNNCKMDIVEQTATKIHTIFRYTNGFIMETISENNQVTVKTSHAIVMDDETHGHVDMNQPL